MRSKLLDLVQGGETFVFDSSEDNRQVFVPLQVLKTWKEMTGNEVSGSESSTTQFSSGQSGAQSVLGKTPGSLPRVPRHSEAAHVGSDGGSPQRGWEAHHGPRAGQGREEAGPRGLPAWPEFPILPSLPGLSRLQLASLLSTSAETCNNFSFSSSSAKPVT